MIISMALMFCDGFEASEGSLKWDTNNCSRSAVTRFGSGFSVLSASFQTAALTIIPTSELIIGYATSRTAAGGFNVSLWSDTGTTVHLTILHNTSTGVIQLYRNGSVIASGTTSIPTSTWVYIEMRAIIDSVNGVCEIRLNGSTTPEILFSGNTRNGGTSTNIDYVRFITGSSDVAYLDDVYFLNTTGTVNKTFLGDIRIYTLIPNANGSYSQLTGSDGNQVNNYQLVNTLPYQTITYNGSSFSGLRDTYAQSDVPAGATRVFGVQNNIIAAKSDSNPAQIKPTMVSGGNLYYGNTQALTTSYHSYRSIYDIDPSTGTGWTVSSVNSLESGMEIA